MAKPLSQDLRLRILEAYDEGQMAEDVAEQFRVHPNTVRKLVKLRDETGAVEPVGHRGGQPRALSAAEVEIVGRLHQEQPDAYLRELADRLEQACGKRVSPQTISKALAELGLTRKKNTFKQRSKTQKRSNSSEKHSEK